MLCSGKKGGQRFVEKKENSQENSQQLNLVHTTMATTMHYLLDR